MGKYIKPVIPGCIGASVAVTFVEYFRHPDLWGIGGFILALLFTFIGTTIFASICFLLYTTFQRCLSTVGKTTFRAMKMARFLVCAR